MTAMSGTKDGALRWICFGVAIYLTLTIPTTIGRIGRLYGNHPQLAWTFVGGLVIRCVGICYLLWVWWKSRPTQN